MDYLLEDIPDELWQQIKDFARFRGLSEKAFLLNAAFNEIDRTGSVLGSQKEKIMKSTSKLRDFFNRPDPRSSRGEQDREVPALSGNPLDRQNADLTKEQSKTTGERYLRMLRTVGIRTLIEDFGILRDYTSKDAVAYFRSKRNFEYTSANTKTSTGKRILSDPSALRFCLEYIVNRSRNVDASIQEKAKALLRKL